MYRAMTTLVGAALILALAPTATAQDAPGIDSEPNAWGAGVLSQTQDIGALAAGVAAGPDLVVALGQRACERLESGDPGRCWGQPWVSSDGVTWEAIEAQTSGLELGRFTMATSGPEIGIDGVASGPGGFVAFGWARPVGGGDGGALAPALWGSADGRTWERIPAPASFKSAGPILRGPWLHSIAGSETGYLLGGTIYGKPAPRAAIWSSPDGLTWTLAEGDEVFDVGAYIDTMETPMAGGIHAIAMAPEGTWRAIAVGSACPDPKKGAGPKGELSRTYDWTTGDCRPQLWRSVDGLTWEQGDLDRGSGYPLSAAANTIGWISGIKAGARGSEGIVYSADAIAWDDADGGPLGRHTALASTDSGFHALIPTCESEQCRRRGLELWSSIDGLTWSKAVAQPSMPEGVEDFVEVDMAAFGDRVVAVSGYWTAPRGDLASMALLSPPLTPDSSDAPAEAASGAGVQDGESAPPTASDTAVAVIVPLPPADASPLPDSVATPPGRIAYVTGSDDDSYRVRLLDLDQGTDAFVANGWQPSWSGAALGPEIALAYTAQHHGRAIRSTTCDGSECSEEMLVARGWRPRWSPDGTSLAFSRSTIDLGDAWVRDLETGSTIRLPGGEPEWSPTGEWLIVTEMYVGDQMAVTTAIRPDGSDARQVGTGWNATWSPDGTRVASTGCGGVCVSDVQTGTTETLFTMDASMIGLAWLADDTIAFVHGGGLYGDLYAVDLEDGSVRSLTAGLGIGPGDLAVSPDGQWLAFSAMTADGRSDIYIASRQGGWRRLTQGDDVSDPAWAPAVMPAG